MKVIHKDGFDQKERQQFRDILRDNCLTSMQRLVQALVEWHTSMPSDLSSHLSVVSNATALTPDVAQSIRALWKHDGVRKIFDERNNELQIPGGSSASYYFDHATNFAEEEYLPTQEDVIRSKLRSTGISELSFVAKGTEFKMMDVGGQRSERRKWLNCFSDVTAVIYLVAINEYDMVLEEDNKTNRMQESLRLFEKLTSAEWFENTSFILFLNKSDILREKIAKRPLSEVFEDYVDFVQQEKEQQGGGSTAREKKTDFDLSCKYIQMQFANSFKGKGTLYPYITCAIDQDNCKRVFSSVRDTVLSDQLHQNGFK